MRTSVNDAWIVASRWEGIECCLVIQFPPGVVISSPQRIFRWLMVIWKIHCSTSFSCSCRHRCHVKVIVVCAYCQLHVVDQPTVFCLFLSWSQLEMLFSSWLIIDGDSCKVSVKNRIVRENSSMQWKLQDNTAPHGYFIKCHVTILQFNFRNCKIIFLRAEATVHQTLNKIITQSY